MKRITKPTKFFTINYRENDDTINKLFTSIKKAEEKYYNIFKIKPKPHKIIVVYSRKEFDKQSGYKSEPWSEGIVKKPKFVMFSPSAREEYVKSIDGKFHSYDSFFDHEINHIFYISFVGSHNPFWLCEGYATYMMKMDLSRFNTLELHKLENPEFYLFHRLMYNKFNQHSLVFYAVGCFFVKYLVEEFGHETLFKLITEFKTNPYKKPFEKKFKKIYGMTLKEGVRKAIKKI